MVYRGTEYNYGFNVFIQHDSQSRLFNILMTKHISDRPYKYGGLCLDTGLVVVTDKIERHLALCDIIKKIVDGIIFAEKVHTERYPSIPYKPFKNLLEEYPNFNRVFTERMKDALSLEKYGTIQEELKNSWEKPVFDPEVNTEESFETKDYNDSGYPDSVLYDCKEMALALKEIKNYSHFDSIDIRYERI